jgi:D-alanyl-D-alanine carboxypeptidase
MAPTACQQSKIMRRWIRVTLGVLGLAAIAGHPAQAQIGSARYSSMVIDASSGDVLEAVNADAPRRPASLTKLMTLYLAFEALRDRRITLDQLVPVSGHAASMEPTKLGLLPGTRITVDQAILGLVTKSANDAAAALGELLGGSEDRFAQMMTLRARALGMGHTTFHNASGLPDPEQWTTAHDLAVLGRRLVSDFPSYYRYFSTPSFVWQRRVIFNHDHLLQSYPGADGMKTGYTDASGYNLVSSAVRGGVRLIGVVMGAASNGERDLHMVSLLNQSFEQLDIPVGRHVTLVANRGGIIGSAHAAETVKPAVLQAEPSKAAAVHGRQAATFSIQVGTYASEHAARAAAAAGRRVADDGETHIEATTLKHKHLWRAQITGLSGTDAQAACSSLARKKVPCRVIRVDARQVASR